MRRISDWMQRFTEEADLPGEPIPGISIAELVGHQRVLIENHRGITEYGSEKIRVQVEYGHLCVCGSNLKMARMTASQLVIAGCIDSIELVRRARR